MSILLIFILFLNFADATPTPPHPGLLLRRETETERKRSLALSPSLSLALPPFLSVICSEIDLSSPRALEPSDWVNYNAEIFKRSGRWCIWYWT
jgi:hypothetical protein